MVVRDDVLMLRPTTLFYHPLQFPIQLLRFGFISKVDVDNVRFGFEADAFAGAGDKEETIAVILNVEMPFFNSTHVKSIGFKCGYWAFVY